MLLTITSTTPPATDLRFLLHKHPEWVQAFDESVGQAHVFYPEASQSRCTGMLLLEIDPMGLVRARRRGAAESFSLGQYVNDRPYQRSLVSRRPSAVRAVCRPGPTRNRLWGAKLPEEHIRGGGRVRRRQVRGLGVEGDQAPVV